MHQELSKRNVDSVYVVGIALDYCVFYSAMDAKKLGYKTYLIKDASRGIAEEGMEHALNEMKKAGIQIIDSQDILRESEKDEL